MENNSHVWNHQPVSKLHGKSFISTFLLAIFAWQGPKGCFFQVQARELNMEAVIYETTLKLVDL
jgi:hypothetical protein